MWYVLKLKTNGANEIIEAPDPVSWRWEASQIGCDYIETVYPKGLKEPYLLVVDESGRMKDEPVLNFFGSWLYGAAEHGEPLVGNILIMKEIMLEDGPDIGGMSRSEAEVILEYVQDNWHTAVREVALQFNGRLKPSAGS